MKRRELEKLGWTTRGLAKMKQEGKTVTALSLSLPALFSKRCGRENCKD